MKNPLLESQRLEVIGRAANTATNKRIDDILNNPSQIAESSIALTEQTASIGTTDLDTNGGQAPAGLYRLTYYLVTTEAGTSGTVKASFFWTDLGAARTLDSATVTFGTLADPASGSVVIQSDGSDPIEFSTTVTAPVGSPEYALNITLERLQ